ncbi:MAG: glycine zipper domain-containing protein, partial [Gammaproteobacteria bacterium]
DTDRILDDLRRAVEDAESLLRETSGAVGDRARDVARDTEDYVRRNPWQAVGIAAGVGLLLGVLLNRR